MAKVNKGAKMSPTATPSTAPAVTPAKAQPANGGPSATPSVQSGQTPSAEQIARRAYELYQQRGGKPGRDMEDWLEAERELRSGARH